LAITGFRNVLLVLLAIDLNQQYYRCGHSIAISTDHWPDDLRLSNIEERFVCRACGKRGADVRPDFNWNRQPAAMMAIGRQRPNVPSVSGQRCPASLKVRTE
jgi:hypothetical protein